MLISNSLFCKCVSEFIALLIYVYIFWFHNFFLWLQNNICSKCIYIVKNFLNCSSMLAHTHNLIAIGAKTGEFREYILKYVSKGKMKRNTSNKKFKPVFDSIIIFKGIIIFIITEKHYIVFPSDFLYKLYVQSYYIGSIFIWHIRKP